MLARQSTQVPSSRQKPLSQPGHCGSVGSPPSPPAPPMLPSVPAAPAGLPPWFAEPAVGLVPLPPLPPLPARPPFPVLPPCPASPTPLPATPPLRSGLLIVQPPLTTKPTSAPTPSVRSVRSIRDGILAQRAGNCHLPIKPYYFEFLWWGGLFLPIADGATFAPNWLGFSRAGFRDR